MEDGNWMYETGNNIIETGFSFQCYSTFRNLDFDQQNSWLRYFAVSHARCSY